MDSSIAAAAAAAAAAGTRLLVGEGRCRRGIGERLLAATDAVGSTSQPPGRSLLQSTVDARQIEPASAQKTAAFQRRPELQLLSLCFNLSIDHVCSCLYRVDKAQYLRYQLSLIHI